MRGLPTNCPLEDWIVTLLYPVFPVTFPLDCYIFFMGGRYFIPNGTSSMPVFQVVTLWDVVWAVTLLLEMCGACSWPCCWKLTPSGVHCRLALLAGAMVGPRLQSTQKGLGSLQAAASKAVFASQDCSAGWDYSWAIWKSQRANYCLDVCILGDLECGARDHMLLSAGAVPNLRVVKRHLPAGVIHHPVSSELQQQREHGRD